MGHDFGRAPLGERKPDTKVEAEQEEEDDGEKSKTDIRRMDVDFSFPAPDRVFYANWWLQLEDDPDRGSSRSSRAAVAAAEAAVVADRSTDRRWHCVRIVW